MSSYFPNQPKSKNPTRILDQLKNWVYLTKSPLVLCLSFLLYFIHQACHTYISHCENCTIIIKWAIVLETVQCENSIKNLKLHLLITKQRRKKEHRESSNKERIKFSCCSAVQYIHRGHFCTGRELKLKDKCEKNCTKHFKISSPRLMSATHVRKQ